MLVPLRPDIPSYGAVEAQRHKNRGKVLRRSSLTFVLAFNHSLYLALLSRKDHVKLIQASMDIFHHKYGGIHLVVIGGIADLLIRSANDETESIAIVDELYHLVGIIRRAADGNHQAAKSSSSRFTLDRDSISKSFHETYGDRC